MLRNSQLIHDDYRMIFEAITSTRYSHMFKYKNQTYLFSITYHCRMHDKELYFYLDPANIKQCLTEAKGSYYNGHKNTTKSGLTCQAWGSNTPHKHRFGNFDDSLNNCRNPDGSGKPWCYTMDPKKRWEYCDIPMCCKYNLY
jgi:hypothetical protein